MATVSFFGSTIGFSTTGVTVVGTIVALSFLGSIAFPGSTILTTALSFLGSSSLLTIGPFLPFFPVVFAVVFLVSFEPLPVFGNTTVGFGVTNATGGVATEVTPLPASLGVVGLLPLFAPAALGLPFS